MALPGGVTLRFLSDVFDGEPSEIGGVTRIADGVPPTRPLVEMASAPFRRERCPTPTAFGVEFVGFVSFLFLFVGHG